MIQKKRILITGATDGIGLAAAKQFNEKGHHLLLHGRSRDKLLEIKNSLSESTSADLDIVVADFSSLAAVKEMADQVNSHDETIDVLINNAGVLRSENSFSEDGLELRFAVNTYAPYLLTRRLLPQLSTDARVINLSSAAQAPVDLAVLRGELDLSDQLAAYAQSKLALTMCTKELACMAEFQTKIFLAVNPGSYLATKMVRQGFGVAGNNVNIGAEILVTLALSEEFNNLSGEYFDGDLGRIAAPHFDAFDVDKSTQVLSEIEMVLSRKGFTF
jgi:NAD(P)-dependent dehydrogenase (short-subunit alcohol dehydrogenase family)